MAQAWKKWQLKVLTPYCCISPDSTVYLIDSDSNRWIICYLWRYLVELQFSWHQNIMQFNNYKQQESLANAKVSDDSLSALVYRTQLTKLAPPHRIAQQYQRNLHIVEKYFQCAAIPSLTMRVYLHSFSRCCLLNMPTSAKFRENLNLQQFKVIQGRWFWYQSKAHIRVPISD